MGPDNNIKSQIDSKYNVNIAEITAGTTYDDVAHESAAGIDRLNKSGSIASSMSLAIMNKTTLAAAKYLTMDVAIADSADNSTYSSYTTLETGITVASGLTTADVETYDYAIDLSSYKRYVKTKVVLDLTATGTDTAEVSILSVLGGYNKLPTT